MAKYVIKKEVDGGKAWFYVYKDGHYVSRTCDITLEGCKKRLRAELLKSQQPGYNMPEEVVEELEI